MTYHLATAGFAHRLPLTGPRLHRVVRLLLMAGALALVLTVPACQAVPADRDEAEARTPAAAEPAIREMEI